MKTGSKVFDRAFFGKTCSMCGATAQDFWQTRPSRIAKLLLRPRLGDPLNAWLICDECHEGLQELRRQHTRDGTACVTFPTNLKAVCTNCNEGLQNAAMPTPDRIHLLAQVRHATRDDQQALLDWLLAKFGLVSMKKP